MAFFGLFGTAPGAYANASLSDKLALLGASLDQRDPEALARTQAGIQSRLQQAQADRMTSAQLGGDPGLDDALGKLGIGGDPRTSLAGMWARAQQAAMGGGGGGALTAPTVSTTASPQPPGAGGLVPPAMDSGKASVGPDGEIDADAAAAQHHAATLAAAPAGLIGGGAPRTGVPDASALMRLAGIAALNPRLAAQAAVLEKGAQFWKPNIVEGSDGSYRNLNDPATAGVKSLPKDGNGFTYVADPSAPGGYRSVATAGYADATDAIKRAEAAGTAAGTAEVGAAPQPGFVRRFDPITGEPRWVDPAGSAIGALGASERTKAAAAADYDVQKVDNGDGTFSYQTRAQQRSEALGGGGAAGGPAPMRRDAAAVGGAPGAHGQSTFGRAYQEDAGKAWVTDDKAYAAQGAAAQATVANADRLKGLLAQFTSGVATPTLMQVQQVLPGVKLQKGMDAYQAFNSGVQQLALDLRSKMPGQMSDGDRKFLINVTAGAGKTPQANAMILDAQKAVAQRDAKFAEARARWTSTYGPGGRDPKGRTWQEWSLDYGRRNPLFGGH